MEMGRRDVRRGGTNRFSKIQSGSGFTAKSKKGMLKKLGLGDDKLNSSHKDHKKRAMSYGFSSSDLEKEVSMKKSKLLKKNLKDINGVDHASVPRKLRSAEIDYHMERPESVSKTQFLSSWEDYAMKKRNLESVSKLSSASTRLNRSKTGIESFKSGLTKKYNQEMEAKAIVSESMMISKDEKEVAETLYGLAGMFTETNSIDNKTCDPLSDAKETSKDEASLVFETDFTNLDPAVSVLSSAKKKQIHEKPLEQYDRQDRSTGMVDFLDRLKKSSSINVTDAPPRAIDTKVATSETDDKSNGLALWPGLSSAVESDSQILSKPSSTKLPFWMGQAVSPSKSASHLRVQPRKLNKCASHIYISHLIKVLQTSKRTLNQIEQRSSEMSERGFPDPVTTINDFKSLVSPPKRYQNQPILDINRTHNPKTVQEGMTQLALYGPHTSQKQSYDFLSLSSAVVAQSHFPLPNSFPQYHIPAAYNIQLSPATSSHQVQQLSPYQASRFQTAYNANQQQQQQLQNRLWAAHYRPPTSVITAPSSSNQYSKPNLSLNLTSIQPLHVTSSTRYNNNVSQQQNRLMAAATAMSMSYHHNTPSKRVMNRQEHHFPLIYEDTRTPLQLLCNEQS